MTTERIIQYDGKIDFYNLQLMQLTESDITSETTDNQVSKKLIDKDGNIVMLIEAQTMDYYSNDDINATKGCFIKRFEFVKELVNTRPWLNFIASFMTGVRYRMVWSNNQKFLAYYNYIWSQKIEEEQCVIAELLDMKVVHKKNDIVTYIGKLQN